MITAGILQFFFLTFFVILSPLLLLTDVNANSSIATGISNANAYISAIPLHNFLVSLIASLVILLLFEAGYWLFKGIKFLYNKIPGIS